MHRKILIRKLGLVEADTSSGIDLREWSQAETKLICHE